MEKLRLRPCKRADGVFVMKWLKDERQLRMWSRDYFTYPLTDGQMDAYYEEVLTADGMWGFTVLDENGRPVGSFRMADANYEKECIHMGFIILAPDMRGHGMGQKMVELALTYAVQVLGMRRVTLKVFDSNPAARHCYEKAGFREAEYRKADFSYGDEMWGNSLMVYEV